MGKYFGTDGVRGVANEELTPELAFKIGRFGGFVFKKDKELSQEPTVDNQKEQEKGANHNG
ncbi:phosphoglucosamine mutase [Bacillus thuringiensis MC28]|nr:phosphoglucosamine mutase [Bacillus thuringiensis MC28]